MTRVLKIKVGDQFGRFTVIEVGLPPGTNRPRMIRCDCLCGVKNHWVNMSSLLRGLSQSCGCLHNELSRERSRKLMTGKTGTASYRYKHGHNQKYGKRSLEYVSWTTMKSRCYDPNFKEYVRYGAKGVKVCDRWMDPERGFQNFLEDMGPCPTVMHKNGKVREYTLDRENSAGDYAPENCNWRDRMYQARGRRKFS